MQKHPNHFIWAAIIFVIISVLYILTTQLSQEDTPSIVGASQDVMLSDVIQSESTQVLAFGGPDAAPITPEFTQIDAPTDAQSTPHSFKTEVKPGDSLGKILGNQGFAPAEIHEIALVVQKADGHVTIFPGQVFEFHKDPETDVITHFTTETPQHETMTIARNESGFSFELTQKPTQSEQNLKIGTISNSLFTDASKAGLSDRIIMQLAQLFQWEIDFALDIRQGDSFKVIYEDIYIDQQKLRTGPILAAEFINNNKELRGFRYEHKDGTVGYYDEKGESLKKAFLKAPVDFARISSKFSLARKHPVLHKIRAHKGVDYAAPRGTPIKTTGRGRIVHAGWKGGYGRTVIVKHNERHSTLYAHMNSFANGLKVGQRVHQGQVIGTIGSTGLATGPHLHYEFRLNGQQVDPLKIEFPKADSLQGTEKQAFLQQIAIHRAALEANKLDQIALHNQQDLPPHE
jgi:murein DD-endopeptidase MepM/ murein hydrolase activator NlpD